MITIDPGHNTAIAFWKDDIFSRVMTIRAKSNDDAYFQFKNIVQNISPCKAYIESVQYSGMKSDIALKTGSLLGLSLLVGRYEALLGILGFKTKLILPRQWKGQLPDNAVRDRVLKQIGYKCKNSHEGSAVGIGMAVLGLMDRRIKI